MTKLSALRHRGFTLIEILIVVAIISTLAVTLFISMRGQRQKAADAAVIADIEDLKVAFEDYYADHNCYPPLEWFDDPADCGSDKLKPYLDKIPCDHRQKTPYYLEKDATGCSWYKVYAILENPKAAAGNKQPFSYTIADGTTYNYGASSSNTTPNNDLIYNPQYLYYYCSAINNCTSNPDPEHQICTPTYYDDPNCGGTPASKCFSVGTCRPR